MPTAPNPSTPPTPPRQDKESVAPSSNGFGAPKPSASLENHFIQAPQVTLPKGGGAIKGIEEKFEVNAANGTASFSIPLPISPARGGFSPQLSVSYNSGGGNGVFGLGWNMGLPAISRKTEQGLPRYFDADESDTFLLSGAEDLVPMLENQGGQWLPVEETRSENGITYRVKRYCPRIEGLFARIERWTNEQSGDIHWRSIGRDNVVTIYGQDPTARIADAANRTFEWLIEFSYDDKGNCIHYTYKVEDGTSADRSQVHLRNRFNVDGTPRFSNSYLKSVRYGNRTPWHYGDGLPTADDFMFETVFDYGEHDLAQPTRSTPNTWRYREDAFSHNRAGFEVRTCRRCERVLLFHNFPELGGWSLVRALKFIYNQAPNIAGMGLDEQTFWHFQTNIFTFLNAVEVTGFQNEGGVWHSRSLPHMTFDYEHHAWSNEVETISPKDLEHLPAGVDGKNYQFLDLDSEGISGILTEQAGAIFYKENLGDGQFSPARVVSPKPTFSGISGGLLQIQELEGNGKKQLVALSGATPGFFEFNDEGVWQNFQTFETMPNLDFGDPNLKFIDLDGDGLPDLLVSEDHLFRWYPSEGKKGFGESESFARPHDEEQGPALVFADREQSVFLADMSGDGLTDIVRIRNGEICYWANLGYGRFGAKVSMDNAPHFDRPDLYNPRYLRLADTDGSGITDIIYLGKNDFRIWMNLSGNAWSTNPIAIPMPTIDSLSDVSVTDLLGNGTSCIVWSSPLPSNTGKSLRYIDLMGGKKPYLMIGWQNGFGKEVELSYRSSTHFYLEDKKAGTPWITKLPFPVHCLEQVVTRDLVRGSVFSNSYTYHHGYYDCFEREFRGFGRVEQSDTEEFEKFARLGGSNALEDERLHQPSVLTKTWFHTGAFLDKQKIIRQFEQEYFQNTVLPEHHLPDAEIDADITSDPLTDKEWREALRACKSMMLRQEVYSPDGTAEADLPYSVAEHNCHIRLLQPVVASKYAVFLVVESEAITYHYERNPADPRIDHTLNLEVDERGNVVRSASVVYPRQLADATLPAEAQAEQIRQHVILTENSYTNDIDTNTPQPAHRLRVLCESKSFEISGATRAGNSFSISELRTAADNAVFLDYHLTPTAGIQKRIIEHVRTLFLKNNLTGALPLGQIESLGLPFEAYKLAFSKDLLDNIFGTKYSDAMLSDGKYLRSNDYKAAALFPVADDDDEWWIPSGRMAYPANPALHFYQPDRYTDPYGNTMRVGYFQDFLVSETEDDKHNLTSVVRFDLRTLQPEEVQDPNLNLTEFRFDALGMMVGSAVKGKGNEADDFTGFIANLTQAQIYAYLANPEANAVALLDKATSRLIYDYPKPGDNPAQKPAVVATILRETHHQIALAAGVTSKLQLSFEYSDGMGSVVLKKIQAEPGEALLLDVNDQLVTVNTTPNLRWVGNGRTILNNKGKPVKQFEPYFSATHQFESDARLVEIGVTPVMFYDPVGRLIRTELPNGTFSKVEFDAWQVASFDPNDTVVGSPWHTTRIALPLSSSERQAAEKAAVHHDTPTLTHLDSLGREILSRQRNKYINRSGALVDETYDTFVKLDIEGNSRYIRDARSNLVMQYDYDMLGNIARQDSMDAGQRWLLKDCMGKPHYSWDTKGQRFHTSYDSLHRPLDMTVRFPDNSEILFEKTEYGEGQPVNLNLRGKAFRQYDGAGIVTNARYDFKGNLLEGNRRFTVGYQSRPDWTNPATIPMQVIAHTSIAHFDALNRPVLATTPDGSTTRNIFNEAGLLNEVRVSVKGAAESAFVTNIDYDSKGQRTLIAYGNGAATTYEYDPETFRLTRLATTRPNPDPNRRKVQDLRYTYDPVGNITHLRDEAQQTVYFNNQVVEPHNEYSYDSLYRLIFAEGREHAALNQPPNSNDDHRRHFAPLPMSGSAQQRYREWYEYDAVGNHLRIVHHAGLGAFAHRWTRDFTPDTTSNRLLSTIVGGVAENYSYDVHGNMTTLPHLASMTWDFEDQLQQVDLGGGGTAYYVYDAGGQRLRKVVERQGNHTEERLYLGSVEFFEIRQGGGVNLARETLHVMDDKSRIALVDSRTVGNDGSPAMNLRYQFSNHLGTASVELAADADFISYEEFYPFGSTAFQAGRSAVEVSLKRYRYTGMERDEETGLNYHGVRYYAGWLGRWVSCDPDLVLVRHHSIFKKAAGNKGGAKKSENRKGENESKNQGINNTKRVVSGLYTAMNNNPITYNDPSGRIAIAAVTGFFKGLFASKSEVAKSGHSRLGYAFSSAGKHIVNSLKIFGGLFTVDKNKSFLGKAWQLLSRFTWELPQTIVGFVVSHGANIFGHVDNVSYKAGATVLRMRGSFGAFTIGSYIVGDRSISADPKNDLFQHEYGHYLQSQRSGFAYLFKYAIPSLVSASRHSYSQHNNFWTEQDANRRAKAYWEKTIPGYNSWDSSSNPINPKSNIVNPKWWEYLPPLYPIFIPLFNLNKGA